MTVIGLTSAKGSPGVTTAALALGWVWPVVHPGRRVLVVDADPAGAGTTAGFLRGTVPEGAGVVEWTAGLSAATRSSMTSARPDARRGLWDHLVTLDDDGTRLLLPGVADPAQAQALAGGWDILAGTLHQLGTGNAGPFPDRVDVLVDLGRAGTPEQRALWRACGVLVVLARSTLAQVSATAGLIHHLSQQAPDGPVVKVVLVGQNAPYRAGEIAAALRVPVAGVLAVDRRAAAVFSDGTGRPRGFGSSALLRSARLLAATLGADAAPTAPVPAGPAPGSLAGSPGSGTGSGPSTTGSSSGSAHPSAGSWSTTGPRPVRAQPASDGWGGDRYV